MKNKEMEEEGREGREEKEERGDRESVAVSQMRAIMLQLKADIEYDEQCDVRDACFVHLYLSDLSLFQAVNEEYCRWFGRNPPSRSCVAVRSMVLNKITN